MKKYFEKIYSQGSLKFYQELKERVINDEKTFIITANPEIFMKASHDNNINNLLLDKNNIIVPDGISVVKSSKYYNIDLTERITGIDICYKLLEYANEYKKSIYLFGATLEVNKKLQEKIKKDYPQVKIVGSSDGYEKDRDKVFKKIVTLKPNIVLVALGVPEQELLIYKYINNFDKGIFVGVGGSFDVISGYKKRAPKIFIKLNLEWLYRIIKEPKRIKRFYQNNIKFIIKVRKDK